MTNGFRCLALFASIMFSDFEPAPPDDAFPDSPYVIRQLYQGSRPARISIIYLPSGFAPGEATAFSAQVAHVAGQRLDVNWFATNREYFDLYELTGARPGAPVPVWSPAVKTAAERDRLRDALPGRFRCNMSASPTCRAAPTWIVDAPSLPGGNIAGMFVHSDTVPRDSYEFWHEWAHQPFGGDVADEYVVYPPDCAGADRALNVDDRASNRKWADYVTTPPVEGGNDCATGIWRPTASSLMSDLTVPGFDPLLRAVLDKALQKRLGTIEAGKPVIRCDNVTAGMLITAPLTLSCTVSDASRVRFVEFFSTPAGGTHKSFGFDATGPRYTATFDPSGQPAGKHYFRFVAWDEHFNGSGNQFNPAVTVAVPAAGATPGR